MHRCLADGRGEEARTQVGERVDAVHEDPELREGTLLDQYTGECIQLKEKSLATEVSLSWELTVIRTQMPKMFAIAEAASDEGAPAMSACARVLANRKDAHMSRKTSVLRTSTAFVHSALRSRPIG